MDSLKEERECPANKLASNCITVLPLSTPPFIYSNPHSYPFFPPTLFRSPLSPNKPNFHIVHSLVTTATSHIVHNLHNSIVSAADTCIRFFHVFASRNPPFNKILSLSSDFQNFSQIHFRNYRKLNSLSNHNFAAILPGDSVAGIVAVNGILNFLNLYNTLLVVRLVLTWFPNSPPAIVSPLSTLCDPYLNIFRGIIPPLGGTLDLSPILAFLVLNAFTSTASALPAELPSTGVSREIPPSCTAVSRLTTSQKKWMRRLGANRSKSSSRDI